MATFASKKDTDTLVDSHGDVVVILVEGKTDEKFLETMFPGMETEIRFESVGGCTLMVNRLRRERVIYPKVFGLLDRDALKRDKKWSVLFETDDEAFAGATRVDGLYVLTRWEIENYLLDFSAVLNLFNTWKKPPLEAEELLDRLVNTAIGELYVTAGWCTAYAHGLSEKECPITYSTDPHVLPQHVTQWIEKRLPDAVGLLHEHTGRVMAFDPGEGVDKRERLIALLRMVDGKRFLERIRRNWLGLNLDPSLQLANNVGGIKPRRDDLYRLVQSLTGHDSRLSA
ncbi:DUF4435 domain-containing protein [Asticcacaulis sp.]|uniref:DUF4435 domain-containing protein n=1 Tax=Asticcacaulis sp. TaxID=1872648 RepID=UPI00260FC857|nr:DUF4435 domain-containing protein [Asticcacaulis sp.]